MCGVEAEGGRRLCGAAPVPDWGGSIAKHDWTANGACKPSDVSTGFTPHSDESASAGYAGTTETEQYVPVRRPHSPTTLLSRCGGTEWEGFPVGVWRSALDLRGSRVDDTFFDEAESVLDTDERASGDPQALAILAPTTVKFPYEIWKWPVGLLLTPTKLVFVRRKGLARRFQIEKINRDDCPQYGRPQPLGPSTFRTRVDHDSLGPIWVFFGTYREAEELSNYFASDYNRQRSSPGGTIGKAYRQASAKHAI